jgi:FkbM family methyltransferase
MNGLSRILRRFVKQPNVIQSSPADVATETDLYYCYRLLLNREPDEDGWDFWRKQVHKRQHTLRSLTDTFLNGEEFLLQREQTFYAFFLAAARQIQLVELDGFKMYARANDLFIGGPIIRGVPYEAHVVRRLRPFLKPGTVFVDIGANIGYFSLIAASMVGSAGRVLAFEPNIDNCELIKLSMRANRFENITVYPFAVADQEGTVLLSTFGSNGMIVSLQAESQLDASAPPTCLDDPEAISARYLTKAVVLDDILCDIDRIDVIKMDIEGFEPRALRGMQDIIRKHHPVIFSELLPTTVELQSGVNAEAYLDALREHQYDICAIMTEDTAQTDFINDVSMSNSEIMDYYARSGSSHVDLIAHPQSQRSSVLENLPESR